MDIDKLIPTLKLYKRASGAEVRGFIADVLRDDIRSGGWGVRGILCEDIRSGGWGVRDDIRSGGWGCQRKCILCDDIRSGGGVSGEVYTVTISGLVGGVSDCRLPCCVPRLSASYRSASTSSPCSLLALLLGHEAHPHQES